MNRSVMHKDLRKALILWLAVAGLVSAIVALAGCADKASEPRAITILHTNDIHGQFTPTRKISDIDTLLIGGFPALSQYVREEREQSDRVLLLDAGDLMTGNLICDMEYKGALGGGLVAMMNRIGYDCLVPGNHMFDHSVSNMKALEQVADFPFVCSNFARDGELATKQSYVILNLDGLRVGIIGTTYHPMVGMVPEPNLEGYESRYPLKPVSELVAAIDDETDLIVLLSHSGMEIDRDIATNVPGLDLIIGGHSHLPMDSLERVACVLIGQAGSKCRQLGRISLLVAGDSVVSYERRLITMEADSIEPDTGVARLVAMFEDEIEREYGKTIGHLVSPWWADREQESNVGNWLTDALRRRLKVDIAFLNTGGIRKHLDAGPITIRDVMEMLPFDNNLVTFKCTGQQLLEIAEHNLANSIDSRSDDLQSSGLTLTWRENGDEIEIVEAKVNGAPLDRERTYSVASIDYIVIHNSERYFGLKINHYREHNEKLAAAIIDEIRNHDPIDARIEGRFRKVR